MWQLIIFNDSAKILVVLILIATISYLYKLMKKDTLPNWNLVLISIAFFTLGICFSIISRYRANLAFNWLEHSMIMLSGLLGFCALYIGKKIKGEN